MPCECFFHFSVSHFHLNPNWIDSLMIRNGFLSFNFVKLIGGTNRKIRYFVADGFFSFCLLSVPLCLFMYIHHAIHFKFKYKFQCGILQKLIKTILYKIWMEIYSNCLRWQIRNCVEFSPLAFVGNGGKVLSCNFVVFLFFWKLKFCKRIVFGRQQFYVICNWMK